jgi:hypothetical protein
VVVAVHTPRGEPAHSRPSAHGRNDVHAWPTVPGAMVIAGVALVVETTRGVVVKMTTGVGAPGMVVVVGSMHTPRVAPEHTRPVAQGRNGGAHAWPTVPAD